MHNNYDLIIFDCDGTLVDSHYMNHWAIAELLNANGLKNYNHQNVEEQFLGLKVRDIFDSVEKKHNVKLPEDLAEQFVDFVLTHVEGKVSIIEGALECVSSIASNYKIAMASNAHKDVVMKSLLTTGLSQYFPEDVIFAGAMIENPKPHPEAYKMTAKHFNISPSKCLVIEDSPTGVEAGVAAGMEVWGFTGVAHDAESQAEMLINAGASVIFSQLIHIQERLGY